MSTTMSYVNVYTLSQKTGKIIFCITSSNLTKIYPHPRIFKRKIFNTITLFNYVAPSVELIM